MNDNTIVKVEHVSKKFCRYLRTSMRYGMLDIAKSLLRMSTKPDRLRKNEFWAVDDVSFELKKGECLGIIGANGSGKSTLLKMLNGIYMPDKGKIEIVGRVGPLIELGAGFHPMLTGRENIYINGAILGMNKEEIDSKFDEIVSFANIGDFLNTPVKNYSSGMLVRLGFAVAAHCDQDILLVDEVLAVGDESFRGKCVAKMKEFMNAGGSTIFISHSMPTVQSITERVIWLQDATVKQEGTPESVISAYIRDTISGAAPGAVTLPASEEIVIRNVNMTNQRKDSSEFRHGDTVTMEIGYDCFQRLETPSFDILFQRRDNKELAIRLNTAHDDVRATIEVGKGIISCTLHDLLLLPGTYDILLSVLLLPTSTLGNKAAFTRQTIGFMEISSSQASWERIAPVVQNYPPYLPHHEWRINQPYP